MVQGAQVIKGVELVSDGYVPFWASGESGTGEYHCSECGYGVTVRRELPVCPMCGGTTWEQTAWRPFTRALDERLNG